MQKSTYARTNCEFAGTMCQVRVRSIITFRTMQAKRKVQAAEIHIHLAIHRDVQCDPGVHPNGTQTQYHRRRLREQ